MLLKMQWIKSPCSIPYHRVIKSTGEIWGFVSGASTKLKLLKNEGIEIKDNKIDLKKDGFKL